MGRRGPSPSVYIEHNGAEVPLSWLARKCGLDYGTLYSRYFMRELRGADLTAPPDSRQSAKARAKAL